MSANGIRALEERVARLEEELRLLKDRLPRPAEGQEPRWLKGAGIFKDDPVFEEIERLGRKIRRGELAIKVVEKRPKSGRKKTAKLPKEK